MRKSGLLLVVVMVGLLAANSSGRNLFFVGTNTGTAGADAVNWDNASNWWEPPFVTPGPADAVFLGWVFDAPGVVINSGYHADILQFLGVEAAPMNYDLTIKAGGSLTTSIMTTIASQNPAKTGVINVEGTFTNNAGVNAIAPGVDGFGVILVAEYGHGILNVNGGTVNANSILVARQAGSTGHVQLNAGVINLYGSAQFPILAMNGIDPGMLGNSTMDITGGVLNLYGSPFDLITMVDMYTASGRLTGYGSSSNIVYDFDGEKLVVTAIPEPATLVLLGVGGLCALRRKNS